jgi:hypothetical protein
MAVEKRAFGAEPPENVVANDSPGVFWTDAKRPGSFSAELATGDYRVVQ